MVYSVNMSLPRTRPSSPKLRRRSFGKLGADAKLLKSRKNASMYRGQRIKNRRPKSIAQFLGIDVSSVIVMKQEARMLISAMIELEKSPYVGPQAKKQRVLRNKILNGEFESAADMLNAPFEKHMELEITNPPPEWDDIEESKEKVSVEEKCNEGGLSKEQTEAVIAQLQAVEKHLRVDSKCGNDFLESYKQETREKQRNKIKETIRKTDENSIKKVQKARQELLKINEVALTPNVERQEEARRKLQDEAAQKIIGEYSERFDSIQDTLAESMDLQERMNDDMQASRDYQEAMGRKLKKWHDKQMKSIGKAMTVLKRIDYNTSESKWSERLSREPGFMNAGGLTWLGKDVLNIVASIFVDDTWQVKLSAVRPLKQSFTALVTLFEVLIKAPLGLIKFAWDGLNCMKSSPLSCITMWIMKALTIALSLLIFYLAFPTLSGILKTILEYTFSGIMHACNKLRALANWMFGDIFGEAFETLSKIIYKFAADAKAWIVDTVADTYNMVVEGIQNLLVWLKDAIINAIYPFSRSSGTADAVKSAGAASSSSWWEWAKKLGGLGLVDIGDPHFQRWLSMNSQTLHMTSIQEEEEDECINKEMNQLALRF